MVILFYTKVYILYKRGKEMKEQKDSNNQEEIKENKAPENIEKDVLKEEVKENKEEEKEESKVEKNEEVIETT